MKMPCRQWLAPCILYVSHRLFQDIISYIARKYMNFASSYAYISERGKGAQLEANRKKLEELKKRRSARKEEMELEDDDESEPDLNLNVFVVTFEGVKAAEQELAGGDPYSCQDCKSILNKYSRVYWAADLDKADLEKKVQLGNHEAYWQCEFCGVGNVLKIEKEEVPLKDDVVYMVESEHMGEKSHNDSTLVFCIDASGSMNTTTEVQGKVDLKYGMSQEEIDMLKQFMEPGDEAQFNYLPGAQNQNKTFISRKQCILSAIESQLNEVKKSDPEKRIGFVVFNSEVTAIGDTKSETVHIVGDKLYNKGAVQESLANFKLMDPIVDSFDGLVKSINKTEAKGQTSLGPALVSALEIAAKGSPGSSVILCTDGLANIGIGQLEPYSEEKKQFYIELGEWAKAKNITVNIVTIKGEGCKMEAIGKLAELTNGNVKVVNPEKLSDDFANVLKDEVVGLNVEVKVLLHRAMTFRNEQADNLKDEGRILQKIIANATKNTRISFEYEVRNEEELKDKKIDAESLKKIPFQAQIEYTSPRGGKFLRVISAECDATSSKEEMKKDANLGVVHQRITAQTAALYQAGDYKGSKRFNGHWGAYLNENFQERKYKAHQNKFMAKNERLNKAIRHKHRKSVEKKHARNESISEEEMEIMMAHSDVSSDSDQKELVDNLMERQEYSLERRRSVSCSRSYSGGKIKLAPQSPRRERKRRRSVSGSWEGSDSLSSVRSGTPESAKRQLSPMMEPPKRRISGKKLERKRSGEKPRLELKSSLEKPKRARKLSPVIRQKRERSRQAPRNRSRNASCCSDDSM